MDTHVAARSFQIGELHFELYQGGGGHLTGESVLIDYENHVVFSGDVFVNMKDMTAMQAQYNHYAPILMTSVTTVLGLFPASLATGIGSDVQRPLATVIVYGLMFSALISMFVLPVFYYLIENNVLNKKKNDEKEYTL